MSELHDKLTALHAELAEIEANLAKVPEWEARRRSLRGSYHGWGEIKCLQLQIRDASFPIFRSDGWNNSEVERIIAVDDKWITIRRDGREEETRYRVADGGKAGTKTQFGRIDVAKALALWAEHQAAQAKEVA